MGKVVREPYRDNPMPVSTRGLRGGGIVVKSRLSGKLVDLTPTPKATAPRYYSTNMDFEYLRSGLFFFS